MIMHNKLNVKIVSCGLEFRLRLSELDLELELKNVKYAYN